jgi:hypothetical protein
MLHFKGKAIVITSLSILASAIFLPASQAAGKIVTLVTHDSFVMDKNLIADFDKQSGYLCWLGDE